MGKSNKSCTKSVFGKLFKTITFRSAKPKNKFQKATFTNPTEEKPNKTQKLKEDYKRKSSEVITEDGFDEFINKAKLKIRATSSSVSSNGGDTYEGNKVPSEKETGNKISSEKEPAKQNSIDLFSDYIRRAKIKIRTTSSMGGSKLMNDSFEWKE